jgi:hypothetical protein
MTARPPTARLSWLPEAEAAKRSVAAIANDPGGTRLSAKRQDWPAACGEALKVGVPQVRVGLG